MTHHGGRKGTHGHTRPSQGGKTSIYRCWQNMIARCTQSSNPAYRHYKKRGITICDRWHKFENFLSDMGDMPTGLTLDRIDNNGNYEPDNCRWATRREQANNRTTNVRFTYQGHEYTLSELARKTEVSKDLLRQRLCRSKLPWTVSGAVRTTRLNRSSQGFHC